MEMVGIWREKRRILDVHRKEGQRNSGCFHHICNLSSINRECRACILEDSKEISLL